MILYIYIYKYFHDSIWSHCKTVVTVHVVFLRILQLIHAVCVLFFVLRFLTQVILTIPSKTRRTKIRQYNPNWDLKNLVRAAAFGLMCDFDIYVGKDKTDPESGLQKFG